MSGDSSRTIHMFSDNSSLVMTWNTAGYYVFRHYQGDDQRSFTLTQFVEGRYRDMWMWQADFDQCIYTDPIWTKKATLAGLIDWIKTTYVDKTTPVLQ